MGLLMKCNHWGVSEVSTLRYSLSCLVILTCVAIIAEGKLLPPRSKLIWLTPVGAPVVKSIRINSDNKAAAVITEIAPVSFSLPLARGLDDGAVLPFHYKRHITRRRSLSHELAPLNGLQYNYVRASAHPPSGSHVPEISIPPGPKSSPVLSPLEDISPSPSVNVGVSPVLSPPPTHGSACCKPGMIARRDVKECSCVYPVSLALTLLNVSFASNWSVVFQRELGFQLGLNDSQMEISSFNVFGFSQVNISMDIAPLVGISFSAREAYTMNYTLVMHKVHFDPSIATDYKLVNFTWFKPPAHAPEISAPPSLMSPSIPPVPSSNGIRSQDGNKHPSLLLILGIGLGVLVILVISVLVIYSSTSHKGKKHPPLQESVKPRSMDGVSNDGSLPRPTSTRFFAFEELREATNNFEASNMLGEGGFGRVFKGILSDGTAVAIKKLSSGGHQGDKEFLVEVEMLSRLHHRNLVKLVGYYSSRDSSQHLLCYELVPNGSLESWLHGPRGANCPLDWDTRMRIALDAARGLAYLHEDSQPCVIHRDFKASNILLENNFHAKVSDFGLAKQAPEGRGNYLSTRVMGTFGYVAPEYAMTGHLLVKSDVYSYGVVLLELLTGRKPVDMSRPSGQENLVTWARPILRNKDHLEDLADPKLAGKYPKEDFVRVCTIAAACVAPEANQRPTMGEVVQSLKMVQRIVEHQDSLMTTSSRPNVRQSSTTYESDATSSMFSSGPFSGLSGIDNDNTLRTAVFSEDLQEGR
ncbi:proline-rich receptor-like protein kinase PERK15 isoform X2 [Nymphaea colorata]|nr:proline-rich receptor-like protein kinase PERK15 isoform X2 [Nymphaea colorata]XP_031486620.1 proline-rich receptor-like protein kinase PERK15 isoform X2 [Nymphaea colorata]